MNEKKSVAAIHGVDAVWPDAAWPSTFPVSVGLEEADS